MAQITKTYNFIYSNSKQNRWYNGATWKTSQNFHDDKNVWAQLAYTEYTNSYYTSFFAFNNSAISAQNITHKPIDIKIVASRGTGHGRTRETRIARFGCATNAQSNSLSGGLEAFVDVPLKGIYETTEPQTFTLADNETDAQKYVTTLANGGYITLGANTKPTSNTNPMDIVNYLAIKGSSVNSSDIQLVITWEERIKKATSPTNIKINEKDFDYITLNNIFTVSWSPSESLTEGQEIQSYSVYFKVGSREYRGYLNHIPADMDNPSLTTNINTIFQNSSYPITESDRGQEVWVKIEANSTDSEYHSEPVVLKIGRINSLPKLYDTDIICDTVYVSGDSFNILNTPNFSRSDPDNIRIGSGEPPQKVKLEYSFDQEEWNEYNLAPVLEKQSEDQNQISIYFRLFDGLEYSAETIKKDLFFISAPTLNDFTIEPEQVYTFKADGEKKYFLRFRLNIDSSSNYDSKEVIIYNSGRIVDSILYSNNDIYDITSFFGFGDGTFSEKFEIGVRLSRSYVSGPGMIRAVQSEWMIKNTWDGKELIFPQIPKISSSYNQIGNYLNPKFSLRKDASAIEEIIVEDDGLEIKNAYYSQDNGPKTSLNLVNGHFDTSQLTAGGKYNITLRYGRGEKIIEEEFKVQKFKDIPFPDNIFITTDVIKPHTETTGTFDFYFSNFLEEVTSYGIEELSNIKPVVVINKQSHIYEDKEFVNSSTYSGSVECKFNKTYFKELVNKGINFGISQYDGVYLVTFQLVAYRMDGTVEYSQKYTGLQVLDFDEPIKIDETSFTITNNKALDSSTLVFEGDVLTFTFKCKTYNTNLITPFILIKRSNGENDTNAKFEVYTSADQNALTNSKLAEEQIVIFTLTKKVGEIKESKYLYFQAKCDNGKSSNAIEYSNEPYGKSVAFYSQDLKLENVTYNPPTSEEGGIISFEPVNFIPYSVIDNDSTINSYFNIKYFYNTGQNDQEITDDISNGLWNNFINYEVDGDKINFYLKATVTLTRSSLTKISSSPSVAVYNLFPTLSPRKNCIGINTRDIDTKATPDHLMLIGLADGTRHIIEFDSKNVRCLLKNFEIEGYISEDDLSALTFGGTWD